jgi:D-sedoheptulose 7-phosphate isomerase
MVGKRALPAISLTNDIATLTSLAHRHGWHDVFAYQLRYLAHPQDIAIAISQDKPCQNVLRGLGIAKQMGLLTIALTGGSSEVMVAHTAVDHLLVAPAEERQLVKEMQVTIYHILWELVHVFFAQPGLFEPQEGPCPRPHRASSGSAGR